MSENRPSAEGAWVGDRPEVGEVLRFTQPRTSGVRVTTTTISKEQYRFAQKRVEEEGLEDRITLLLKDYRELEGTSDKLVSIEMIEAVGTA